MKGKDIVKYTICSDMPDLEQVRLKCREQLILQSQRSNQQNRPLLSRTGFAAVSVAVLSICILLVSLLINPQIGDTANAFAIRTYAMERLTDGSIALREVDLIAQTDSWGAFNDGENFFLSIRLRAEGENIQNVSFFTDYGFFAKQYLEIEGDEIIVGDKLVLYLGESHIVAMVGTDFEIIGNAFVLDGTSMADNLLLFLGAAVGDYNFPRQMTVRAVATFDDGTAQEKTITISLYDNTGIMIIDDADHHHIVTHAEWWRNIKLEEAELLAESVKVISGNQDGIIYKYHIYGFYSPFIIYGWQLEFDESGIFWGEAMSDFRVSDGNIYFSLVRRDDDGELTGMVYRIQIDWEEMNLQEISIE